MLRSNFRSYTLAVQLYRQTEALRFPVHLKTQLDRAASSVVLNLAEGSAKSTPRDRKRFYAIAFGSLREVQAILDLSSSAPESVVALADQLAAHLYRLTRS